MRYLDAIRAAEQAAWYSSRRAITLLTARRIHYEDGSVGMPCGDEKDCIRHQEDAAVWSKVHRVLRGIETS